MLDVAAASDLRLDRMFEHEIEGRLDVLLANYQRVTANPRSMGYLRFLLRYYAKKPHPFTACCLASDTPIDCPRDHERYPHGVPISQIQQGQHVWSFNESECVFELKPVVRAWVSRKKAQLYKIVLDDGSTIRATEDHPFLRRDGSWAPVAELAVGDSLMPLYRDFTPRVKLRPDAFGGWKDEHQAVVDEVYGDERMGLHAHHVDERYRNTSIENFELLTGSEHRRTHVEITHERFQRMGHVWQCIDCDQDYVPTNGKQRRCVECRDKRLGALARPVPCQQCGAEFRRTKRHQLYCSDCAAERGVRKVVGKTKQCATCEATFVVQSATQRFCSATCRDAKGKKKNKGSAQFPIACKTCGEMFMRMSNNQRYCEPCRESRAPQTETLRICRNCGEEFFGILGQRYCDKECRTAYRPTLAGERGWNHKIVSVDATDQYEDVWDLEVLDNHNFVVMGVVAHNCADNLKRFGPGRTERICAVLKDTLRQTTYWRHGHRGHSKVPDAGAPGVAIGEADKGAAPAWGGHHHMSERPVTLLDELDGEFGVRDHCAEIVEVFAVLDELGQHCDVYRVLLGLDEAPVIELREAA